MRHAPVIALCVAACVLVLAAAPAGAARAPITGKLSKPGYTVIALASNGKARSVRVRPNGSFRLRLPADSATLHLRTSRGRYGGPIVIRATRTRAVVGVRAGASLGTISVRRGYARVLRRLPDSSVDPARDARARRGVPIGARRFGRVRSRPPRGAPAGDRDLDGIPNPLDIDDDGDLILDNLDRSTRARTAQSSPQEFNFEFNIIAPIQETANANAAGLTATQTDDLLVNRAWMIFEPVSGGTAELDCGRPQRRTDPLLGGLVYCSRGGTGRIAPFGSDCCLQRATWARFPDDVDSDGDGFGSLNGLKGVLSTGATSAGIGTGDLLIQRVTSNGVETGQFASTLQYAFATVPALVSYSDGQGNSVTVSYPVPGPNPVTGVCPSGPPPCSGPGTRENPFPVKAGSNGDVVLTLRFWRPQRTPIPGETGEWIDIGGLVYEGEGGNSGRDCPQRAFTAVSSLTPAPLAGGPGEEGTGGLRDAALDAPANRANTITYKLSLSACLGSETWQRGATKAFNLRATDRFSYAAQQVAFKRE